MEQEPNNDFKTASAAALPNAFNGIIETDGDIDYFKFQGKKDQTLKSNATPVASVLHWMPL